jgi:Xaa-Pro aminopeptidase
VNRAILQKFSTDSRPDLSGDRVEALRKVLAQRKLEGWLLPRADIFQGEYIPASENRLGWLSGFTGSAGFAVILRRKAALFVDGRYTTQAKAELDRKVIKPVALAETSPDAWLQQNAKSGARIGYDPALFTARGLKRFERAAEESGFVLVAESADPFTEIWQQRPAAPATPVVDHPKSHAGEDSPDKLARLQARLGELGCAALVVSECPSMNWLFNLRAGDVPHLPILRAFALVPREGRPVLFVDPARLEPALAERLAGFADIVATTQAPGDGRAELALHLRQIAATGARIRLDEDTAPVGLSALITEAGGKADLGADPLAVMKAAKNPVEIEGSRQAHKRDGLAMVRFLHWLDGALVKGPVTEIDATIALEGFRAETGALVDISFPSIAGAGPNAALPHYRVTEATNRAITPGLFLIDSGGQYRDGTTDITRTIAVGTPTRGMRDAYTRVLKGMIAISLALFPKGTSGAQLDTLARQYLWQVGKDFDHGTGHGVGSFLSVHEGPQRISKLGHQTLLPGMILSNEPGYYREGQFGIRIENLVIVEERHLVRAERAMYGFETVTLCPIDTRPVIRSLLSREERAWLNAYHRRVLDVLSPGLGAAENAWLEQACRAL